MSDFGADGFSGIECGEDRSKSRKNKRKINLLEKKIRYLEHKINEEKRDQYKNLEAERLKLEDEITNKTREE